MTPHPSHHLARLLILAACLMHLPGCITRWPDAPYLDVSSSLDPQTARALEQKHPGSKLISPVYRRHMENAQGQYHIVSRLFLFEDANGLPHRGHLAIDGPLHVAPVVFMDALPTALHDRFFNSPSAIAPGGQLKGKAWRFQDPQTTTILHEFEFTRESKRHLGRLAESNALASAELIVREVDE